MSRSDFLRDDKWDAYLPVTHQFSFACPWEMIQPQELPEQVGLYWIRDDGKLKQVRKPVLRPMDGWPTTLLYHLVLSHLQPDRYPFFTDQQAYLEGWVEDQNNGAMLGYKVRTKLMTRLRELEAEHDRLKQQAEAATQQLDDLRQVLEPRGLWRYGYTSRQHALEDALDGQRPGLAAWTKADLEQARTYLDRALHAIAETEAKSLATKGASL